MAIAPSRSSNASLPQPALSLSICRDGARHGSAHGVPAQQRPVKSRAVTEKLDAAKYGSNHSTINNEDITIEHVDLTIK